MLEAMTKPRHLAIALIAAGLMPATPAQPATLGDLFPPGAASCFVATYDSGHLARNPKQTVGAVRLVTVPEHATTSGVNDTVILDLDVTLRSRKKPFAAVGLNCLRHDGDVWSCQERVCNPRFIEVTAENANALTLDLRQRDGDKRRPGGLTLRGECGSREIEKVTRLTLGAADQIFRLKRAPAAACR